MFKNNLKLTNPIRIFLKRQYHLSRINYSAEASPLFQLRQKTGIAYNLCREALNKHNNDVSEAEAWLKAQAITHGLQKATKVRGRSAREGLIGLAIHDQSKFATIIKLNCETDFVSKNQIFKDLVLDLTQQISSIQNKQCDFHKLPDQDCVERLVYQEEQLKHLDDQIVPMITKLGENIRIEKAIQFRVKSNAQLFGQIHAQADHRSVGNDKIELMSGRFGAIVALEDLDTATSRAVETLKPFGKRLCQHVIGFNPSYIELPAAIRKHLEEEQKKMRLRNHQDEPAAAEEEEEDDKEEKYLSNNNNDSNCDDWPSIMDQQLIMSDDSSVRDFCKENRLNIVYFTRFECGSQD